MVDVALVEKAARKHALQNALQHGQPNPGAVAGRVLGESPELRAHSKDVMAIIQRVVVEVAAMSPEAQKAGLDALGGATVTKKVVRAHPFKPLPKFDETPRIVMRFAPNPNGPATLGHSRGMVTHSEYKRLALDSGKPAIIILRFDDTDPQVKPPWPEAYRWIQEDFAWIGEVPDRVLNASDRIPEYYKACEELIRRGAAYACFCTQEDAKATREAGKPCPHRDAIAPAEHLAVFHKMVKGDYNEGDVTVRIKTEVDHKDPALRDWVAFRMAKTPHPMVGDRYKTWPMLDFESAVEDHLQGVTHIIRGKDLMDSTSRQKFLYAHMGWTYPEALYWGRVRLDEIGKFSSSGMKRDIAAGKFTGWDDPRLPTLRAYRRRGFSPQAIRNFWIHMGLSEKDVAASLLNFYSESAKLLEPTADRYFFVHDPVPVEVSVPGGVTELKGQSHVHPDHPERGVRRHVLPVTNGKAHVLIARDDAAKLAAGAFVRMKDLGNLRIEAAGDKVQAIWAGDNLDEARKAKASVFHWVPDGPNATVPLRMLRPEPGEDPKGIVHVGLAESAVRNLKPDAVVQFERYGYARIERVDEAGIQAVFAHR